MKKYMKYVKPTIDITLFEIDRTILGDLNEGDGDKVYGDYLSRPDQEGDLPTGAEGEIPWL